MIPTIWRVARESLDNHLTTRLLNSKEGRKAMKVKIQAKMKNVSADLQMNEVSMTIVLQAVYVTKI